MPYCYYTCNLLPPTSGARRTHALLAGHACATRGRPHAVALSIHPMTCLATKLVAAADELLEAKAAVATP